MLYFLFSISDLIDSLTEYVPGTKKPRSPNNALIVVEPYFLYAVNLLPHVLTATSLYFIL